MLIQIERGCVSAWANRRNMEHGRNERGEADSVIIADRLAAADEAA